MRISAVVAIGVLVASGGPILAETRSTYVPPFSYSKYDCPQLVQEARALSARSATLVGLQPTHSITDTRDNKSAVIPWPRAFSGTDDTNVADKLALMRGQMLAIEEASVQRQCSIQFQRPPN
jgi:hypothetical protein